MNSTNLTILIPTFLFVSLTPGLCMTLSMSLGMTIGFRRTFWMMSGELLGVGLVAAASIIGVAAVILQFPMIFTLVKVLGGLYLVYLGSQMWLSQGKLALKIEPGARNYCSAGQLAFKGFFTAVANPKGWAFCIALLPPFVDHQQPLFLQLCIILVVILCIEFFSLILYAGGGRTLSRLLQQKDNVQLINRIAGSLMLGVGFWLAIG
ncbi:MAG: LysE family translocator [Deltaproteobacteria bacterium]|nr:LysE family translocator [Deltaproteobacteria bacterium]